MDIKRNIETITAKVEAGGARLIAVSKTQPVARIKEAYDAGQRIFGENKVQEMVEKHPQLPSDISWHLIGHLQTNKVKLIVPFVSMIHAVDSDRLAEEINKQAARVGRVVDCLLQVHIAQEESKFGFAPNELIEWMSTEKVQALKNIAVRGLMGMATLTEDAAQVRKEFNGLRKLLEQVNQVSGLTMNELSMGMSSDYEIALEEGSTLVRVGTAIFGDRNNKQQ